MDIILNPDLTISYVPGSYQDREPADLLRELDTLKDRCIEIGTLILTEPGPPPVPPSFQQLIPGQAGQPPQQLHSMLEGALVKNMLIAVSGANAVTLTAGRQATAPLQNTTSRNTLDSLIGLNTAVLEVPPAKLYPLLACRQLLQGFVDAKMAGRFDAQVHDKMAGQAGLSVQVGTPNLSIGAGGQLSTDRSNNYSSGIELVINAYLIPTIRWLDYIIKAQMPDELPKTGDVIECFIRGTLSEAETQGYLALNGCSWKLWRRVALARTERLSVKEIMEFARREDLNDNDTDQLLKDSGWHRKEKRDIAKYLYDAIPAPAELIHFLQRSAFDTELVNHFSLMEGFAERFEPTLGEAMWARGWEEKWRKMLYASSWILPSPTQHNEMLWRNRPGAVPQDIEYVKADRLLAMRDQHIPPWYRERLFNLTYRVIQLRQLRQLYNFADIDDDQVLSTLQDDGYKLADAQLLLNALKQQKKLYLATTVHGESPTELQALYTDGYITEAVYRQKLADFGFPTTSIDDAVIVGQAKVHHKLTQQIVDRVHKDFVAGDITQGQAETKLTTELQNPDLVNLHINEWISESDERVAADDGRYLEEIRQQTIKTVREGFITNHWNAAQALFLLQQSLVSPNVAQAYVNLWAFETTAKIKWPPLAHMVTAAKGHKLGIGQLAKYLQLEGYGADAIATIVSEILLANTKATQAQQQALQKALAKQTLLAAKQKKHADIIKYNYNAALKKADLLPIDAAIKDKVAVANNKKNLDYILALAKETVELEAPLSPP